MRVRISCRILSVASAFIFLSFFPHLSLVRVAASIVISPQDILSNTDIDGSGEGAGLSFLGDFTLRVPDAKDIGNTAGVSANTNGAVRGTVSAEGTTAISGSLGQAGVGNSLKALYINGTAAKTVTASAPLYVQTTTIGAATLGATQGLAGTTLHFSGDGAFLLSDGYDLTVNVTNAVSGQGTVTVAGASTLTGGIGNTGSGLKLLTIGSGTTGKIVTVSGGDVKASTINFAVDNQLKIPAGYGLTGTVTSSANNIGTLTYLGSAISGGTVGSISGNKIKALNIDGGTFTLGHNVGATTTTVNNAAAIVLASDVTMAGDLTLAGTSSLSLGSKALTLTGTGIYTQGAGTGLSLTIDSASTFGHIAAAGNAAVSASSGLTVNVGGYVADGTTFKVVDGGGGAGVGVPGSLSDNSNVLNFTASSSSGDLILTASRVNTYDTLVSSGSSAAPAAQALESLGSSASGDMLTVLNTLDTLGSSSEVDSALKDIAPESSGAVAGTSFYSATQALNTITNHVSGAFTTAFRLMKETGISAGDVPSFFSGTWLKGFGGHYSQKPRSGQDGYVCEVSGIAAGIERMVQDALTLGASIGYAFNNINNRGGAVSGTDVDSYQGSLYAFHTGESFYITSGVSLALNSYQGRRMIDFGSILRQADAEYSGQQYSVFIDGGYVIPAGGFEVTPLASLLYQHLRLGSYTETGAGSLNLSVKPQRYDVLQSGLGVRVAYPWKRGSVTFTPEVHYKWLHDFIADKVSMTSSFTGGGASFSTNGATPDRNSHAFGAGVVCALGDRVTIEPVYTFECKEKFKGHSGSVVFKFEF